MSNKNEVPTLIRGLKWWLDNSDPGEKTVYHTGKSFFNEADRPPIAKAFWQLAEQGAVLLTQRRLGEERYEYIATRC